MGSHRAFRGHRTMHCNSARMAQAFDGLRRPTIQGINDVLRGQVGDGMHARSAFAQEST